jgi:hypothetical protein
MSFRRMSVLILLLVICWGCQKKVSPGSTPQGEGPEEVSAVRVNLPSQTRGLKNQVDGKPIFYETFKGRELTTFHTNKELTDFLLELSSKLSTKDNFGKPRIRPNMSLWDRPFENVRIGTAVDDFGRFLASLVKKPIYLQADTGVFELVPVSQFGLQKLVIKYKVECEPGKLTEPHSVLVEAWFMSQLAPMGLTTNVVYYSDPETVTQQPSNFKKVEEWNCPGRPDLTPNIRYLISEKSGKDMFDHFFVGRMSSTMEFADKIRIGGQMILYLEKLHSLNVVHGDAHLGNWIIKKDVVSMIDFGRSKIISVSELRESHCAFNPSHSHLWATKWEMRHCPYSYGDDVIQAVFMTAIILHGIELKSYVEFLADNQSMRSEHLRMKDSAMFFEYSPTSGLGVDGAPKSEFKVADLIPGHDAETIDQVRQQFAIISEVSSNEVRPRASKPDYEKIKQALSAILFAIDGVQSEKYEDLFKLTNVT